MVRLLGVDTEDRRLEIHIGDEARRKARVFVAEAGLDKADAWAILAPAAKWQAKRWSPDSYARLARLIVERGMPVVVLWGPGEKALAETVAAAGGDGVRIAPPTNLKEMAALIEASSMLIGTDSGITHMADAVGTPSIVLYGPTDPRVWHSGVPDRHVALYADELDCLFCNLKQCETHECMENLTPERVMESIDQLCRRLRGSAEGARGPSGARGASE